jgi:hypothetical protein
MKRLSCLVVCVAFLLSIIATLALAAPSCTGWMKQNDGSYWRTCVDDKGRQYCESSKNGRVSRVSCR